MVRALAVLVMSLAAMQVGCGGSTTDGGGGVNPGGPEASSCTWTSACGGDVTGTWKLVADCVVGSPMSSDCPGLSESETSSVSGTIEFDANGTYTTSASFSVSSYVTVPGTCLAGVTDCAAVATAVEAQVPGSTGSCSGTTSTQCNCTLDTTLASTVTGTYSTTGSMLTLSPSTGSPGTSSYCVTGTTLRWQAANADGTTTTINASK